MKELWLRQIRGVLDLELRKTLLSKRALPVYALAFIPVFFACLFLIVSKLFADSGDNPTLAETPLIFANFYEAMLRFLIYMGCVWTFMNLFRGEVIDRSLHYYFLSPIRREVLVAGKFLAGLACTVTLFVGSVIATMVILYSSYGISEMINFLIKGPGFTQLLAYSGVTLLACLGYGTVFLLVGLFFKNPIIPAALFWVWEAGNPFMPALLKKVSVIFYLKSLLPVEIADGPFAIIADPVPAYFAIPGFVLFMAATLIVASLRIRHLEISYASD
jgi:ABC-type transport system involved in multi-copper enzyme maturation permease subunit